MKLEWSDVPESYAEARAKANAAYPKADEQERRAFLAGCRELFQDNDGLQSFTWLQGTPDPDFIECPGSDSGGVREFRVYSDEPEINGAEARRLPEAKLR